MRRDCAAWVAARQAVEAIQLDVEEIVQAAADAVEDQLTEVAAAEQERCLAWATSGLPLADIIDGIKDGTFAPAPPNTEQGRER